MNQIDRLIKDEVCLQCNTKEDFDSLMSELASRDVTWVSGEGAVAGSWGIYQDGVIICTERGMLCYTNEGSKSILDEEVETYRSVSPDHPMDKLFEVGDNRVMEYINTLLEYEIVIGDRYRFSHYDDEYMLVVMPDNKFNLVNVVLGTFLTASFDADVLIDVVRYVGKPVTHVNGTNIL